MFERWESELKKAVQQAQAPFLGLLGGLLTADARRALKADIAATPGAWDFSQRLEQFPALFSVWLAERVMYGIGQSGTFAVHPFVQEAVGAMAPLSSADRERLSSAFRRALRRLGLEPIPQAAGDAYRLIGDFTRQAGVPLHFADDLAERMLRYARQSGLPDQDDHEGLLAWQAGLVPHLQLPFSKTARQAVMRDTQAYYAHAFARLATNGGQAEPGNALEEALAKAFACSGGAGGLRRSAPPQLQYRDGYLGVLLPAGQPGTYRVQWGPEAFDISCGEAGTFYPLPTALGALLEVRDQAGRVVLQRSVWDQAAGVTFLAFSDAGRLVTQGHLAAPGAEPEIELPPGKYVLLCRFSPDGADAVEAVSDQPRLVEAHVELRPGALRVLTSGPGQVALLGQERPALTLEGRCRACVEGHEIYFGSPYLLVDLPASGAFDSGLELRVRSHAASAVSVDRLRLAAGDQPLRHDLTQQLAALRLTPGLHRLQFELCRPGESRAVQRASAWYWAGLRDIDSSLQWTWDARPNNLRAASCQGLQIDDDGMRPADALQHTLRAVFDIGQGRHVYFSWRRPGVYVEVETPSAGGTMLRAPRALGSVESVSPIQRKSIVISSHCNGRLVLGSWSLWVDFERRPSKALSAGFLAGLLEPGARELAFVPDGAQTAKPLLRLSRPHVAESFKLEKLGNALAF